MGKPKVNTRIMSGDEKNIMEKIEAFLDKIDALQALQDKTGVKKLYIAAGISVFVVIFILFGFGAGLLCNFVGFVYPAYASFKSLESQNTNDDRLWLTYWVVYSCFCLIEGFLEYVLFWVPFYYPIKLAFLFFLFLPQTKGAMKLYEQILRPALKPYVTMIDSAAGEAISKVQGAATKLSGRPPPLWARRPSRPTKPHQSPRDCEIIAIVTARESGLGCTGLLSRDDLGL